METREKEYFNLIETYKNLSAHANEIKEEQEDIKLRLANYLHEDKINEKLVTMPDSEPWRAYYQDRNTENVDKIRLMEVVGKKEYETIVSSKTSTSLTIRKAAKEKKENFSKTSRKPVDVEEILNQKQIIPLGSILS